MYLLIICVCSLICVFVYHITGRNSRLYNVMKRYPARFTELPVIGSFYRFLGITPEEMMLTFMEVANTTVKLGGVSRVCGLNYNMIVLANRSDVAEVLKHYLNKNNLYTYLQMLTGKGSVFNTEYSMSKVRRQAMLPSFNSEKLSLYTDSTWRQSVRLTEALAPHVGKGPFPIDCILGGFCFDNVIGAAGVEEINEEFSSEEECANYTEFTKLVIERWMSIWMHADLLHRLTRNCKHMERRVAAFYTYVDRAQEIRRNKLANMNNYKTPKDDIIEEKEEEIKPGIFDSLIGSKLAWREISEEILVMLGASDEAHIAIFFTLKLLGLYPAVQDRVYEELKYIFGESDRPLVKEDLTKPRYLDMVIKEALRLYPPVPLIMRTAHAEIELSSGNIIPAGAGVAVVIISLHRNPEYWGADAEHFDPERFLPERLANVPDNAYMPFSYGPRSCPGYKFAYNIVKIGLCAILRKYKVVDTPATGPVPDIRFKYEITVRPVDSNIELVNRR